MIKNFERKGIKRSLIIIGFVMLLTLMEQSTNSPSTNNNRNEIVIENPKNASNNITLFYSGYIGGTGAEQVMASALDSQLNFIVAGYTASSNFPTLNGNDSSFNGGTDDMFIFKVSSTGTLLWSTYFGGSGSDQVSDIAVDSNNNIFIVGTSDSASLPLFGGYDSSPNGGTDIILMKLNSNGEILWASCFGGTANECGYGIALNSTGSIFVSGTTLSSDMPILNAYDPTRNTNVDGCVLKFSSNGNLLYSSYFGGSNGVYLQDIVVDCFDNYIIAGPVWAGDLPLVNHYATRTYYDFYFARFNSLNQIIWSTYIGGSSNNPNVHIDTDAQGNVYFGGETQASNFPCLNYIDNSHNGGTEDWAVGKFAFDGSLLWSTYVGSSGYDGCYKIVVDDAGLAYVTGMAGAQTFPLSNSYDSVYNGGTYDGALVIFNPNGSLNMSTFIGGTAADRFHSLCVDPYSTCYLAGISGSTDFPILNAYQNSNLGSDDSIIVKINPFTANPKSTGFLNFSTFLGGTADDQYPRIQTDSDGNIYVIANVKSSDLPTTTNCYDSSYNGGSDAYFAIMNPTSSMLLYATYLGGTGDDNVIGMTFDVYGNVYLLGSTSSTNYPTTVGAYSQSNLGSTDIFVTKLNSTYNGLNFSTYFGGSAIDQGYAIAVASDNSVYVSGETRGGSFPSTAGAYDTAYSGDPEGDCYISHLSSTGATLLHSTFLGGSAWEAGVQRMRITPSGDIIGLAAVRSSGFPVTGDGWDTSFNGGTWDNALIKMSSTLSTLIYSSYLGGNNNDYLQEIFIDNNGYYYIVGSTTSSNFPMTANVIDTTFVGSGESVIMKFNPNNSLNFSTYFGGSLYDGIMGIKVDTLGNIYLGGYTSSTDFTTTTDAFNKNYNGGTNDIFFTIINATGTGLLYSTYIGGSDEDLITNWDSLSLNTDGTVSIGVYTKSSNFPMTIPCYDNSYNGMCDLVIMKLNNPLNLVMPNFPPVLSAPLDQSWTFETTNHNITWVVTDAKTSVTNYTIYRNGTHNATGTWSNGMNIVLNIDGLSVGTYNYTCIVQDGLGGFAQDQVMINVTTSLKPTLSIQMGRFFGGSGNDNGFQMVPDSQGNLYVCGNTRSSDLPMLNSYDNTYGGGTYGDGFLAKFTPNGTLLWSTYLGASGSYQDSAYFCVIDSEDNIIVTGRADSGFPAFNGYDTTYNDGGGGYGSDVFIMKFNSTGTPLWSTFVGGDGLDLPNGGIVLDESNNIYIAGSMGYGSTFPTVNAYDSTDNGGTWDAFVFKLSASGMNLLWSTIIGGSGDDYSAGIALNSQNDVIVAFTTNSANFPLVNAIDSTIGGYDMAIVRFNNTGTLLSSTYFGGSSDELNGGNDNRDLLIVDQFDNVYLTAMTYSGDLQIVNGNSTTLNGSTDAFLAKFSPTINSITWSTYIGGSSTEDPKTLFCDPIGTIWISIATASSDLAILNGFNSSYNGGSNDLLLMKFGQDGIPIYSSYLGGNDYDMINSIYIQNNILYLCGYTLSSNFPTTISGTYGGLYDAYMLLYSVYEQNATPILTSPSNQTWVETSIGHSISWTATDSTTQSPQEYSIWQGSTCVQIGTWTSGIAISYSLDGLTIGSFTFEIQINDGLGVNASDTVSVDVVANVVPTLSNPSDQSWNVGTTGHSVSWTVTDTTTQTPRSYSIWQGSTCIQIGMWISGDVISYTLDGLLINTYIFELQVNDGFVGGNSSDQVSVTVLNILPSLTSPADQLLLDELPGHCISWTVNDSSTQLPRTYSIWQGSTCIQIGFWVTNDIISIGLDGLPSGNYIYELQVNDGFIGGNSTDSVAVSVGTNIVPSLTAPGDQSWNVGTTSHSVSWTVTDATTQTPRTYAIWQGATCVQIGTWTTNDVISYTLDGLAINTYIFELQVNDGIVGGNSSDQVSVTVLDVLPSLDTPADQSWEVGTTGHSISWTATDVSTQTPRVFSIWQGATCIATGNWVSGSAIPQNIDGLAQGSYIFEIQVNDGYAGGNASDSVSVTVNANTVPSLTSPADQNRVFGSTGYFISWTATDASIGTTMYSIYRNGTLITSNSWVSTISFSISLDGLNVGIYNYTCVAWDGNGGVSQDEVIITITNILPMLSAPADVVYTVGTVGHNLIWTPTDVSTDSTRMYSIWRGVMCLATGTWTSGVDIIFSADGFSQGTWVIELQINDGYVGGNASDSVILTVTSNSPPVVSTPADQTWLVGTIGQTLNWTINDGEMGTTNYAVYQNGIIVRSGSWTNGNTISMNLTDLEPGMYNYTILVNDGLPLGQSSDSAWIIVWNHAPEVSQPLDQSWAMNTTGHSVSWVSTDVDFGSNVWYNITQNGVLVVQNAVWFSGAAITRGLDSLLPGTYFLTITFCDGYSFNATVSDTVQITVSNANPILSSPADLSYGNGTLGHLLNWTVSDVNTMNANYQILTNGVVKVNGGWISDGAISFSVDGLSIGTHNITILVNDGYNGIASDIVWITVYDLPPILYIQQPTNGSIFTSINNLGLQYYVENIAIQTMWYKVNSSNQWVIINSNTTFNVLFTGYHSVIVVVQSSSGQNYTSAPAVFRVMIENNSNTSIEILMQVISGSFQAGQTMEVQITITNKGTVDLTNVNFYLERATSEYQLDATTSNNYTFTIIATSQSKVFMIRLIVAQTTNQILIRGHFTADIYHQEFAYPLTPGNTTSPLVYVFSVAGVATVGGGYYGLKKKKGLGSKSVLHGLPDKHADKHEPSLDKNNDVEFQF